MVEDETETIRMMEFALFCASNHPELLEEWGKERLKQKE